LTALPVIKNDEVSDHVAFLMGLSVLKEFEVELMMISHFEMT